MHMVAPVATSLLRIRYDVSTPLAWRESDTRLPNMSFPVMPTKQTLLPNEAALAANMAVLLPRVTIMSEANFSLPISGSDSIPLRMMSTLSSPMAAISNLLISVVRLCGYMCYHANIIYCFVKLSFLLKNIFVETNEICRKGVAFRKHTGFYPIFWTLIEYVSKCFEITF